MGELAISSNSSIQSASPGYLRAGFKDLFQNKFHHQSRTSFFVKSGALSPKAMLSVLGRLYSGFQPSLRLAIQRLKSSVINKPLESSHLLYSAGSGYLSLSQSK